MLWLRLPNTPAKHGWAFFYYLRRRGDRPQATKNVDGSINVFVAAAPQPDTQEGEGDE